MDRLVRRRRDSDELKKKIEKIENVGYACNDSTPIGSSRNNAIRVPLAQPSRETSHDTASELLNLTSRLDAPTLTPKLPDGTTQFWLVTSQ